MVFANISVTEIEEANASIFAEHSTHVSNYDWNQTSLDASWFRMLARKFTDVLGPARVLDIGCGNGELLSYFKSFGWSCVGLDPSPWSKPYAESRGFELLSGFPEDFRDQDECFDLVVSSSTLEHVADPKTHVRSMVNFVRPGGRVYLCGVPNYASWAVRTETSSFFANKPPMHVNYFTPKTLGRLMQDISPSAYRICTYGVPELHRVLYRRRQKRQTRQSERSPRGRTTRSQLRGMKLLLLQLAVNGYYWAGAPLRLGDKLELEVIK